MPSSYKQHTFLNKRRGIQKKKHSDSILSPQMFIIIFGPWVYWKGPMNSA